MKIAYVAGPFRAKNSWLIEQNIRRAEELSLEVWNIPGWCAICPHTNTRFFQGAAPDQVWLEGDLEILRRCDAVVLTWDWRISSGARAEVEEALRIKLPIFDCAGSLKENHHLNPHWLRLALDNHGRDIVPAVYEDFDGFGRTD